MNLPVHLEILHNPSGHVIEDNPMLAFPYS